MTHTIENCLIMGTLFIIIFIPIYRAVISAKNKRRKKIGDELLLIEKEHSLSLQAIEQFDSFIIGIDRVRKMVVKMALNDYSKEFISLENVEECTLQEKKPGKTIQQLQLILSGKNRQPIHQIVFYQQYIDNEGSLKRASIVAAQWEVMIKAII